VLGFDSSHSDDGTALVACTEEIWLFPVEIIERPDDAPDDRRIDRGRIHRALEHMMTTYSRGALRRSAAVANGA